MARLQQFYREKVVPDLVKKFGYTSVMQAPRITKITLNMGVSEAVSDKKVMDHAVSDLTKIAGQKPVVTKSKKAIAGFKIRDGVPIGCMVTLRGVQMYEFLERLVSIALPRVRDFRGINDKGFDGRSNPTWQMLPTDGYRTLRVNSEVAATLDRDGLSVVPDEVPVGYGTLVTPRRALVHRRARRSRNAHVGHADAHPRPATRCACRSDGQRGAAPCRVS